jgi:hypothetical protein
VKWTNDIKHDSRSNNWATCFVPIQNNDWGPTHSLCAYQIDDPNFSFNHSPPSIVSPSHLSSTSTPRSQRLFLVCFTRSGSKRLQYLSQWFLRSPVPSSSTTTIHVSATRCLHLLLPRLTSRYQQPPHLVHSAVPRLRGSAQSRCDQGRQVRLVRIILTLPVLISTNVQVDFPA